MEAWAREYLDERQELLGGRDPNEEAEILLIEDAQQRVCAALGRSSLSGFCYLVIQERRGTNKLMTAAGHSSRTAGKTF